MRTLILVALAAALAACEAETTSKAASDVRASVDVVAELSAPDGLAPADVEAGNPEGCPATEPSPNGACEGTDRCAYGQECCCGECSASFVCTCAGGTWACYYTDFCLRPACPDAVAADVAADTSWNGGEPDAAAPDDALVSDVAPPGDGSSSEVGGACPAEAPLGVQGVVCPAGQRCEYGQECCCGECAPSTVCECWDGAWGCHSTDFCLIPGCPDDTPPEGACRTNADCEAAASCRRPDDPSPCGICRHPGYDDMLTACQADADCATGQVCEAVQPPTLCLCEPATICVPACGADVTCAEGQACSAGHCGPIVCNAEADCPTFFGCGAADACVRLACTLDADCGPGRCVGGSCYAGFGVCQLPVP